MFVLYPFKLPSVYNNFIRLYYCWLSETTYCNQKSFRTEISLIAVYRSLVSEPNLNYLNHVLPTRGILGIEKERISNCSRKGERSKVQYYLL